MRVLTLIMLLTTTAASVSSSAGQSPARVVEIVAERFEFWPAEVSISEGEVIELRLRSDDTTHGFRLVGTSTNLIIPKRGKGIATATLSGLAAGTYTFECSRMCGAGHHFMRGTLTVKPAAGSAP